MEWKKTRDFWIQEANEALQVARHLIEKADYSYALFFGHLAIEKLLKAVFIRNKGEQAPYIHNLHRLAEMAGLPLSEYQKNQLIKIPPSILSQDIRMKRELSEKNVLKILPGRSWRK